MANWPSVFGGAPSPVGLAPNCQVSPLPRLSTLVQPSWVVLPVQPVNPSVVPVSLKAYPGPEQGVLFTVTLRFFVTSALPMCTEAVAVLYPGYTGVTVSV